MDTPAAFDPSCIFCQIVAGEAEASVVYQDDLVFAFLDITPVSAGHTLVIPKAHAPLLTQVDEAAAARMLVVGARIDRALREAGLRCEAVSLYLADGAAAGQAVGHAHLHVIPRYRGDASGLRLHSGAPAMATRHGLDDQAATLRQALEVGS